MGTPEGIKGRGNVNQVREIERDNLRVPTFTIHGPGSHY